jgi:ABC-2 type transport system permease protein
VTLPFFLGWRLSTLKNGIQDSLAYRWDFLLRLFGNSMVPASVQFTLWYSAFKLGNATTFGGSTYSELIAYTSTSILFSQLRSGDQEYTIDEMIRTGTLSTSLLRPVSPLEFTYLRGLGEKLSIMILASVLALGASLFTSLQFTNFLQGLSLGILGSIINFQVGCAVVTLAFYWEQAYAALMTKNIIVSLLSGEMLPLNIFPENLTWVWKALPFYLYVYGPTQIALGRWNGAELNHHLWIAIAWIIGLAALVHVLWAHSIRRYQALGG